MKNSMVEQILLLIEENRTLRRELEDWRVEAERVTKELERVFEYGAAWDPEFKTKFYRARASASTLVFGTMIPESMRGAGLEDRQTATKKFQYGLPRFECEGPPETEEVPSELERTEKLKEIIQEGYDAAKRQGMDDPRWREYWNPGQRKEDS
jgi:hypothetical protein